ncbi:uncharacterized protein LOC120350896 isoform X2 [Nilaparvata lugens]|uniref:uncharacterized protein LOC120350896 isoform X2 n=1 Tax=Nilaparvata lugens TaxID=108931 RepID=UPI00193E2618|nr:uncharacterized protein LOC120350896 isoform X2 [Nilaparvata lugens]
MARQNSWTICACANKPTIGRTEVWDSGATIRMLWPDQYGLAGAIQSSSVSRRRRYFISNPRTENVHCFLFFLVNCFSSDLPNIGESDSLLHPDTMPRTKKRRYIAESSRGKKALALLNIEVGYGNGANHIPIGSPSEDLPDESVPEKPSTTHLPDKSMPDKPYSEDLPGKSMLQKPHRTTKDTSSTDQYHHHHLR